MVTGVQACREAWARPGTAMLLLVTAFTIGQGSIVRQTQAAGDVFYGGSVGLGFGDVNYIEIAPLVGKHVNERLAVGGSVIYRHRSDDRFQQELTTDDYGFSIFSRYYALPGKFVQAEYEYLDYEFYRLDLSKDRDTANSFFLGGGVSSPVSSNSTVYATASYNILYDDDDSPYDSPWVIRFGIGVGF